MTSFDKRKDAYESKFARDAELRFRAQARRNKLVGLWAAEQLGKKGPEADAYAREIVAADFEEAGDEDVFRRLRADLDPSISDHVIRRQMEDLLIEAAQQVESEGPRG